MHVYPLLHGDSLEVRHRVTQPIDRKPPPGALGMLRFGCTAGETAQHGHHRGQLLVGGFPLDYLGVWLVRVLRLVGHGALRHSGMFPCFLGGRWETLRSSRRSAVAM